MSLVTNIKESNQNKWLDRQMFQTQGFTPMQHMTRIMWWMQRTVLCTPLNNWTLWEQFVFLLLQCWVKVPHLTISFLILNYLLLLLLFFFKLREPPNSPAPRWHQQELEVKVHRILPRVRSLQLSLTQTCLLWHRKSLFASMGHSSNKPTATVSLHF